MLEPTALVHEAEALLQLMEWQPDSRQIWVPGGNAGTAGAGLGTHGGG